MISFRSVCLHFIRHPPDAGLADGENVFTEQAALVENCSPCAILAATHLPLSAVLVTRASPPPARRRHPLRPLRAPPRAYSAKPAVISALASGLLYLSHPTLAARVSISRSCRYCCKSPKW